MNKPSEVFTVADTQVSAPVHTNTDKGKFNKNRNPFQGKGTQNPNSSGSSSRKCHYCQKPDHLIKDCRKLKQKEQWDLQNAQNPTNFKQPGYYPVNMKEITRCNGEHLLSL